MPSTWVTAASRVAPLGAHREDARHEAPEARAARRQLEVALGDLGRDRGREGAELLAALDARLSRSRISALCGAARMLRCPSARGPSSARAVHPADDLAAGQRRRDALEERRLVRQLVEREAVLARDPRQLVGVDRRAPERMVGQLAIGLPEMDAVGVERRAERAPGVARRRRHEDPLEPALAQDARVGAAVERHAAAEAQIRQARLRSCSARARSTRSSSSTACTLAAMSA